MKKVDVLLLHALSVEQDALTHINTDQPVTIGGVGQGAANAAQEVVTTVQQAATTVQEKRPTVQQVATAVQKNLPRE